MRVYTNMRLDRVGDVGAAALVSVFLAKILGWLFDCQSQQIQAPQNERQKHSLFSCGLET